MRLLKCKHVNLPPGSLLGSDEDGSSEVFLPADSDYDSSDALSPRDLDPFYSPPQDLSQQALHLLGGSAPDVLQIHELRWVPEKIFGPGGFGSDAFFCFFDTASVPPKKSLWSR